MVEETKERKKERQGVRIMTVYVVVVQQFVEVKADTMDEAEKNSLKEITERLKSNPRW